MSNGVDNPLRLLSMLQCPQGGLLTFHHLPLRAVQFLPATQHANLNIVTCAGYCWLKGPLQSFSVTHLGGHHCIDVCMHTQAVSKSRGGVYKASRTKAAPKVWYSKTTPADEFRATYMATARAPLSKW